MPRLETQINQIYLANPEAKKTSLILYEEALSANLHLFVVAELRNMQRKSESGDLKKISDIILTSFRTNKKLPAETLFETALAQINQNLADLAHEGSKSWVGKFSCLITLKSSDNIFLASNGQTAAWLKRKSEMLEVLPAEKLGTHPLKTFQNFTQGKLIDQDELVLTTANVFNYVSFSLFTKILSGRKSEDASVEISKILRDSAPSEQAFCCFFISVSKKLTPAPIEAPTTPIKEAPVATNVYAPYAPIPEEMDTAPAGRSSLLPKLPSVKLPKVQLRVPGFLRRIRLPHLEWSFVKKLSPAGKFFFASFTIFLILFIVTLSVNGFKLRSQRIAEAIERQADVVAEDISLAQSALIYKNDAQAFEHLMQAQADYKILAEMSAEKAQEYTTLIEQLKNQVNKTTVAQEPRTYAEFNRHPIFLAKNPQGFLVSGIDSNSLSTITGGEATREDIFLLNSLNQEITAVAHWPTLASVIAVADKLYYINSTLKQFESFITLEGSQIDALETYNNNLYALDTKNGRLLRIMRSGSNYSTQSAASGDLSQIRDFAVDGDFYLLSADKIVKVTKGQLQAFTMPFMTDPISNATRIFAGNNLYVLEPAKKRVVIMSKSGGLINQISFPTTLTPLDLFVDETERSMYLLDDNKLLRITF